jgi:hypothetical protein
MQNFRPEAPVLNRDVAIFGAAGDDYRVTITVERKDGKTVSETEARRIYTEAMTSFPQVISVGRISE